jgi:uncharacterized protein YdhG (YjbR/CyaY superfamily)
MPLHLDDPFCSTLHLLRQMILEIVRDAQECISYRIPAFRIDGNVIAGFAAFSEHLSYLPLSYSTLASLAEQPDGYTRTKSALHSPLSTHSRTSCWRL